MDAAAPRATLVNLAHAYGVATEYWDWQGAHVTVADATIRAVLGALGVEAADDEQVALSLEAVDERQWRRVLPATVVCREGWTPWVPVHVPHGSSVRVEVELEDGTTRVVPQVDHWVEPREVDGVLVGEATFELPGDLPLGWHRLHAHIGAAVVDRATETADAGSAAGSGHVATATLVVTPATLALPESLRDGRVWGLMEQVYQVRSERSWGIGDLSDLAELAAWAGEDLGADFVLVNPLHAAEPVPPMEPSPYLPTTRRFVNPVYLRVEEIPEAAGLTGAALRRAREAAESGRALNTDDTIDRDAVWAAKRTALEEVNGVVLTGRGVRDFDVL